MQSPRRTIGRLSVYRRVLLGLHAEGKTNVFSHQLASIAGVTAAQVRRDLMGVGYSGSPNKGYAVESLMGSIGQFLDGPGTQPVALVGIGNIGRALLAYFARRRPNLTIVAAFDADPSKVGRVIHGCRCYGMESLGEVLRDQRILTTVIAVPADQAQQVADSAVSAGVKGLLNFAPVSLRVPASVYVEDVDITTLLEKVAFFARQ